MHNLSFLLSYEIKLIIYSRYFDKIKISSRKDKSKKCKVHMTGLFYVVSHVNLAQPILLLSSNTYLTNLKLFEIFQYIDYLKYKWRLSSVRKVKKDKAFCFLIIAQISLRYRLYFKAVTMYSTCICIYNFYEKTTVKTFLDLQLFFCLCISLKEVEETHQLCLEREEEQSCYIKDLENSNILLQKEFDELNYRYGWWLSGI